MRVVVTGASGTIGPAVVEALRERKYDVVATPSRERLDLLGDAGLVSRWLLDAKPDAIVHLAGARPPADAVRLYGTNCGSLFTVLEGARELQPRPHVLLTSSAAVYGPGQYGASKRASEILANSACAESGLPLTILRLFNVIAPRDSNSVIADFYERFVGEPKELTVRNADAVRDFIDVRDAAAALAGCIQGRIVGTYDVGTGRGLTVLEAVGVLARQMEVRTALLPDAPSAPSTNRVSIADVRALHEHGWRSKVAFETSIRDFVEYRKRRRQP